MMGLMCAFCFGVLGKTALDAVGYEVVGPATAEVAGMNSRDLRLDRDFRRAVQQIIEGEVSAMIELLVPSIIERELRYCQIYVDGEYGTLTC